MASWGARTLPGARRLEEKGDDEYAITVAAGVGSVKAVYEGTFSLTDKHAPDSGTVRASARGRWSRRYDSAYAT